MSKIFTPVKLGQLFIKNRIAQSSTQSYLGYPDGRFHEDEIQLAREMAQNEVGLLFSPHTFVSYDGQASPCQNRLDDDRFIENQRKANDAVHQFGARRIAQITHAGRLAIANAEHPDTSDNLTPDTLTEEQMERVRGDFIRAAVRAQKAEFDGVEVHCAHGYLLSSMISPVYNHRTDAYGGSAENRFRLAEEIIQGIREACGPDYPIFIKINSNVEENDEAYEADLLCILRRCEQLGIAAAELSGYNFRSFSQEVRDYYLERAARMQVQCSLPLILVGGIKSFADIERALDAGMSMVSIARGLLCEPDLITRLKAGQERTRCINCNRCSSLWKENGKRCVFHEKSYPRLMEIT